MRDQLPHTGNRHRSARGCRVAGARSRRTPADHGAKAIPLKTCDASGCSLFPRAARRRDVSQRTPNAIRRGKVGTLIIHPGWGSYSPRQLGLFIRQPGMRALDVLCVGQMSHEQVGARNESGHRSGLFVNIVASLAEVARARRPQRLKFSSSQVRWPSLSSTTVLPMRVGVEGRHGRVV